MGVNLSEEQFQQLIGVIAGARASAPPATAAVPARATSFALANERSYNGERDPTLVKTFLTAASCFKRVGNISDEDALDSLPLALKDDAATWWNRISNNVTILSPVLKQADETMPYVIKTDASGYGLSAVLVEGEGAEEHAVEYASRLLTPAERNDADAHHRNNNLLFQFLGRDDFKKLRGRLKESAATVYSSNSRLNLLTKRKRMNPLTGEMSSSSMKPDRYVTQRVLSAKTHRVKQLQNQLADAQYHLQELSNENRVLRAMQKKQEIALQRYENSNAELPQVLSSHSEEIRIQQTKYKQLKQQCKEALMKLKERDMQLQQLRDEHQHLLELSKDRNLLEREKLQSQLSDLQLKVQQQNETISTLQRKLALEAKNFKHQLQAEINKHKDTRHDLDLAITNADKLSTIIEMKEKIIYTARQGRTVKSPVKTAPTQLLPRKLARSQERHDDDRGSGDQNDMISKLCENSRSLSSALSHDEDSSSSVEPRLRYQARSRLSTNSSRSTSNNTRKSSKGSDDIIEMAKTVQDGIADLSIFDEQLDFKNASPDEVQKKLDAMKADLINKIKNDEPLSRKSSAMRRRSTDESIEEEVSEADDMERPKSRGRKHSNVSFYEDTTVEENTTTVVSEEFKALEVSNPVPATRTNIDKTNNERKLSGKPIETYCKEIIHDIEKSNKVIDKHMREYSQSKFNNDSIVQHLQAVDKINELVNINGEIPPETLSELNNNFNMLSEQVFASEGMPVARKRSVSGRRNSRVESRTNLFGDSSLSNQDLLNDLLRKK